MKSIYLAAAALLCSAAIASAQEAGSTVSQDSKTELLNVDVKARADWQGLWDDGNTNDANTGFEGKYLMLKLDGEIVPGLKYAWRQRFNKSVVDGNFFDAADWINLTYSTHNFEFSAGKQIVGIGGYEYDLNPADVYSYSLFTQNIACYQFGASVAYNVTPADKLMFQVSQSMFHSPGNRNMYSYNLMWTGRHGLYSSLWSVNLAEYAKGRYISYIALGNQFELGPVTLQLDFMNRAASHQAYLFRDCSVMGDLSYAPSDHWRIHAKMTYDVNRTNTAADLCVLPGTEFKMAGGAVEFFPLRKKRTSLRLHAGCYYGWGRNTNAGDLLHNKSTFLSCGVTWDMNLFKLYRK